MGELNIHGEADNETTGVILIRRPFLPKRDPLI